MAERIYVNTIERILTGVDIGRIEKTYPKYLLVTKLVQALDDTARDWYADLLLYRLTLTKILSINIIGCETLARSGYCPSEKRMKLIKKRTLKCGTSI